MHVRVCVCLCARAHVCIHTRVRVTSPTPPHPHLTSPPWPPLTITWPWCDMPRAVTPQAAASACAPGRLHRGCMLQPGGWDAGCLHHSAWDAGCLHHTVHGTQGAYACASICARTLAAAHQQAPGGSMRLHTNRHQQALAGTSRHQQAPHAAAHQQAPEGAACRARVGAPAASNAPSTLGSDPNASTRGRRHAAALHTLTRQAP